MEQLYIKALKFARKKHKGQFRADGVTSYINHPIAVANNIIKYKSSKDKEILVVAGLLHDTLEDTYTSYKELVKNFGEIVASIVMEVTSASYMPKLVGKSLYLKEKMLMMSNYALDVKLADRLANIEDSKSLSKESYEKTKNDTIEILEYLMANRELTDTQLSLISAIKEQIKQNEILLGENLKYEQ